jgi:hypothetical protein
MISQYFTRGGLRLFCSLHGNDKDDIKQHKGGAPGRVKTAADGF